MLFELWDDQEARRRTLRERAHGAVPQAMKGIPMVGSDIKKYTIAEVGPVR